MKMFNTSLDDFQIQCDSIVFQFNGREYTEVPDTLYPFIYNQFKERGIFPVLPSYSKEKIKEEYRKALLSYLGGHLRERIANFTSQEDEFRKKGVTFRRARQFETALRWEKEICELLEMEAPIVQEFSFLDADQRKKLGITDERIEQVKGHDLFADFGEAILIENGEEKQLTPKRGRPKTFKEGMQDLG